MKIKYTIILFTIFSVICQGQISTICLPDKGIKTAKTYLKIESKHDATTQKKNHYREVHYDEEGRVVFNKNSEEETRHQRIYQDGKLQMMLSTSKMPTGFFSEQELDSIKAHTPEITDTAFVVKYHENGEPAEIKGAHGIQTFEFEDCQLESSTLFTPRGDKIQSQQTFFENGVVVKSIWTLFQPVESDDIITVYYDYEFNKKGHWIKRKYMTVQGLVIEKRKLSYY